MSSDERWCAHGWGKWGIDTGTVAQFDKYRAQELAYGHAGFIGSRSTNNIQWVAKEHHLMHAVQRLYGTAKPTEISYEIEGRFVSASVVVVLGGPWRQRIRYDSGLTLWINWRAEPWKVEGRELPQWGFLALGPDTEACMILKQGKFADYAECPQYVFVDARTSFNMPYLRPGKDIEPRLAEFKYLGGDRLSLTYRWIVNDTLDGDFHCFVHFINSQSKRGENIEFLQDHSVPKPTSQWRKGEVVTDGPHEIRLRAPKFDTYDIVIGLYKGKRVQLKGVPGGGGPRRILIGRLKLDRDGDRITNVTLGDISEAMEAHRKQEADRADFTAHLNPEGTWIDLGKVATDGSVKVNKGKEFLTVFPYPREKLFKVAFDVKAVTGDRTVDQRKVRVRALEMGTGHDLGEVAHRVEDGRIVFEVGASGVGRYAVEW